jgi:hypothetical protein
VVLKNTFDKLEDYELLATTKEGEFDDFKIFNK